MVATAAWRVGDAGTAFLRLNLFRHFSIVQREHSIKERVVVGDCLTCGRTKRFISSSHSLRTLQLGAESMYLGKGLPFGGLAYSIGIFGMAAEAVNSNGEP